MIRETCSGQEKTSGAKLHSLINREYMKFFPNANANMNTKLHHQFHKSSLNGEFSKVRLGIEKQQIVGSVTYDDVVELE